MIYLQDTEWTLGLNTKYKERRTPKDNTTVNSQNLQMTIHLKRDLIVEVAFMHKLAIITVFKVRLTPKDDKAI